MQNSKNNKMLVKFVYQSTKKRRNKQEMQSLSIVVIRRYAVAPPGDNSISFIIDDNAIDNTQH